MIVEVSSPIERPLLQNAYLQEQLRTTRRMGRVKMQVALLPPLGQVTTDLKASRSKIQTVTVLASPLFEGYTNVGWKLHMPYEGERQALDAWAKRQ